MLFSGTIDLSCLASKTKETNPNFRLSIARLETVLESQARHVKKEGSEFTLLFPGADSMLPGDPSVWEDYAKPFWDRFTFKLNSADRSLSYTLNYWSTTQVILHGLITLFIAMGVMGIVGPMNATELLWKPQSPGLQQILTLILVGNSLPILMSHMSGIYFINTLVKKLRSLT